MFFVQLYTRVINCLMITITRYSNSSDNLLVGIKTDEKDFRLKDRVKLPLSLLKRPNQNNYDYGKMPNLILSANKRKGYSRENRLENVQAL